MKKYRVLVLILVSSLIAALAACADIDSQRSSIDVQNSLAEQQTIEDNEISLVTEIPVPPVIGNPTPDSFRGQDYFIFQDTVWLNAYTFDRETELELSEGALLGEIIRTGVEDDFLEWDASTLPVGTRIFENLTDPTILIAVHDDFKTPYLKMVEG